MLFKSVDNVVVVVYIFVVVVVFVVAASFVIVYIVFVYKVVVIVFVVVDNKSMNTFSFLFTIISTVAWSNLMRRQRLFQRLQR